MTTEERLRSLLPPLLERHVQSRSLAFRDDMPVFDRPLGYCRDGCADDEGWPCKTREVLDALPKLLAVVAALRGLDLTCENYVGTDNRPRFDGCGANGRLRDGDFGADQWCLPCEIRAALAALDEP